MLNKNEILEQLNFNYDIINREFKIGNKIPATIIMIDGMTNKESVNRFIVEPLINTIVTQEFTEAFAMKNILSDSELSIGKNISDCITAILNGDAVLLATTFENAIIIGAKGYATRGTSEPPTSINIKGPREGFTEDMKKNSILLRRKLKTENLVFNLVKVGKYSGTNILVCHIKGIADESIVQDVIYKLEKINIDGILDSSYISSFLDERKNSIFRQIGTTEKPDILAAKLLEGRIGIIVDGSPITLTTPFMLLEDYQSPQDYHEKHQRATFSRLIRLIGAILGILLPSIYVAALSFHIQLIPLRFLSKILFSVKEIPLPPAIEMFVVLLIFEILRESSIRMPKYVGGALSVVGGLVLGDTAVKAGIISSPSILIIAISSISVYTVPDQEGAITLLRVIFLLIGSTLGILGIMVSGIFLTAYLVSLSQYNVPYLAPFAPHIKSDLKDSFIKKSILDMQKRPTGIPNINKTRLK